MLSIKASNGQYFDLENRQGISLTISPNDLGELNSRSGVSSYDFTLPLTAKNRGLLTGNTIPVSLLSNNQTIQSGFLTVYEYDETNKSALCSFFGGNAGWFDTIKDKVLTDLSLDLSHFYTIDNIVSSFENTQGFIYVPCEWGRSYNEQQPVFNTETGDIAPAVYVHTLFKEILNEAGVSVTGELFEDDRFLNSVIPLSKEKFSEVNAVDGNINIIVSSSSVSQSVTGSNNTIVLDVITNGATAFYDINGSRFVNATATPINVRATGEVYCFNILAPYNITIGYRINSIQIGTLIVTPVVAATTYILAIDNIFQLQAGDELNFYIESSIGASFNCNINRNFVYQIGEVRTGFYYNPIKTLPIITQQDFLKWVVVSWGVILSYNDKTKVLTCNLYERVRFKTEIDWSSKVSKVLSLNTRELIAGYSRINYMGYEGNEDDTLIGALTEAQLKGSFFVDDESLEAENDYYTAPFTATLQTISFQGGAGFLILPNIQRYAVEQESVASGAIQIGVRYTVDGFTTLVYNNVTYVAGDIFTGVNGVSTYGTTGSGNVYIDVSEASVDPQPRVLIVRRGVSVETLSQGTWANLSITDGVTELLPTTMPYAYFMPTIDINGFVDSLSYSLLGQINLNQSLIQENYLGWVVGVINNKQLVKFEMNLNDIDISTIDYSTPIRIEYPNYTGLYLVSKIDGYNSKDLTSVYLIKI